MGEDVVRKIYPLGETCNDAHFSQREAECMIYMMEGKSAKRIARQLDLSPRTIEFYIENMRQKLNCHTKYDLVELVLKSDFKRNFYFA